MKNLTTPFYIIVAFLLVACGGNSNQIINIDDKYEIQVPSSLGKRDDLNDEASLQYGNPFSELYTVVIDETSKELVQFLQTDDNTENDTIDEQVLFDMISVEDYFDSCTENWAEHGMQVNPNQFSKTTINNFPAYLVKTDAVVEGIDIHYNIAVLKGKKAFYQIYVWTLVDRKSKHEQTMKDIINSFKEL